jgi:hypothetical protein
LIGGFDQLPLRLPADRPHRLPLFFIRTLPLPVLGDEFHNGFFEGLGSFVRLPDQGRKKGGNKQLRAQDRAWREQQKKSATPDSSATRRLRWGRLP